MHILFANTGVQTVCVPLRARYATAQTGYGWQRCRCRTAADAVREFPYIQWQIIQTGSARLFLAVDTTCGDPEIGYFCAADALVRDHEIRLENLLDIRDQPLRGLPPVDVCIRPATATAGDPKHVHWWSTSATAAPCAAAGDGRRDRPGAQMMPFELNNRYHMDAWSDAAEPVACPARAGSRRRPTGATRPICRRRPARRSNIAPPAPKRRVGSGGERGRKPTRSKWRSPRGCSTTCRWSAWGPRPTTCCRSCGPRATSAPA